ncbi:hypothetical protein PHMEG_0009554 [Phytophthora megakarya]|uniref:Uncharacterized protein n=1 Tax=Phytophthora megakarya TaxID=4795 RepID=A0A225WHM8_9STRA|nr:hypothetical protein PHMEG_0009554 [Phytophthora megakarya]
MEFSDNKNYRIPKLECKIAMKAGVFDMLTVLPHVKLKLQKYHGSIMVLTILLQNEGWRYFKRTWTKKYPSSLWNISLHFREVTSRTNNPLDRFNREMNDMFRGAHPNLADFVSGIDKLARRHANKKVNIELSRVRDPVRNVIRISTSVELPDFESGDSEEGSGRPRDYSDSEEKPVSPQYRNFK